MDRRKNTGRCMAVLGLSLVVAAALPAGASTQSPKDSSQEASREKKPTPTSDSTAAPARAPRQAKSTTTTSSKTPPSTVTVEPSSTTTTAAAPAKLHSPTQVDSPARRTPSPPTPPGVVTSGPATVDGTSKTTETTSGSRNPHVVENDEGKVPLPAFGEAAPTTTSTEVSNAVVGNIGQDTGPKPAQAPRRQPKALGRTGASTRPLLMLAGSTLLLGALAIAFGEPGAAQGAQPAHATAGPVTGTLPGRRRRPERRTPPGWESGVPLAPERREQARQRMQSRPSRPRVSPPGGARGA